MPGGGFTGDTSVKWYVEGDDNRVITVTHSRPGFDGKSLAYRHEGVDETPQDSHFVITIHFPRDPIAEKAFRKALNEASLSSGPVAILTIPVEDHKCAVGVLPDDNYQITVNWPPL